MVKWIKQEKEAGESGGLTVKINWIDEEKKE